jgi:hypothetical protein
MALSTMPDEDEETYAAMPDLGSGIGVPEGGFQSRDLAVGRG